VTRIIAGTAGGRRLLTPPGEATRPTTDRVREALFSALVSWAGRSSAAPAEALAGIAFLDLYAGSGAVGLEAASRGAVPVTLVEGNRRTAATVTGRNVAAVASQAEVRAVRVEQLLATPAPRPYDVVFLDPPYALPGAELTPVLAALVEQGWLAPDGLAVLERSVRTPEPSWPAALHTWSRRYGETVLWFAAR
jgi:16S rRNA (guanine966-N2)-methyltransferase